MPTVLQAYGLLEARGLIEPRPRSGWFVRAPRPESSPAPRGVRRTLAPSTIRTGDLIVDFLEAVADPRHIPLGTALPAEEPGA